MQTEVLVILLVAMVALLAAAADTFFRFGSLFGFGASLGRRLARLSWYATIGFCLQKVLDIIEVVVRWTVIVLVGGVIVVLVFN
jgi:hypothetical protein